MDSQSLFDSRTVDFLKKTLGGRPGPKAARLLGVLAFQRLQALKRRAASRRGRTVPPVLIASVTRRCNLSCAGCYSRAIRPEAGRGELTDERFMEIFREAVGLGVGSILVAGGEPLLRRGLLERLADMRGILVPVFTNGTLVDSSAIELFARGSLVPVFSIEGGEEATAERRGLGVHETVMEKAAALRERGALFGLSVTVTSRNAASVASRSFLEGVAASGAAVLFLVDYVPVAAGTEDLVVDSGQKAALEPAALGDLPFGVVRLPGDEEAYGGCLAAGRGFIHVSADGRVEACPFAPFSDSGVAEGGLAAALDSPLMRAIRERHAELTETSGGCALWNRRGWVASLGACASAGEAAPVAAALRAVPEAASA